MTIVRKISQHGAFWHRLVLALILAIAFCLIIASPARAQDLADYFQISYDPVTFDKVEVTGDKVFHVAVAGRASCAKDLPLPASEATVTAQVIARHNASGAEVTLNTGYTIDIKPFPDRAGDTIEIDQTVPLQFPASAQSGDYNIIAEIIEAKAKVIFWLPVTDFLPREQPMGTVKYTAPETQPDTVKVDTEATPTPAEVTPPPSSPAPVASTNPEPAEPPMPWWVELIIFIAIATTIFNIAWFLRHRHK